MASAIAALLRQSPLFLAVWLLTLSLAYSYAISDIGYALVHGGLQSSEVTLLGRDFVNVYTAGQLVLEGNLAQIYDVAWYQQYQEVSLPGDLAGHNYSYPPVSFLYAWAFALLPYGHSYLAWIGLTGAAFALAARPYLKEVGLPAVLVLLLPASIANIWAGHYGFLVAALWLFGWRLLGTRPRLGGILLGCLLIKPHMALLLPLVLAWRGSWAAFRAAACTVCALILVSGTIFGWELWSSYVTDTLLFQASLLGKTGVFYLLLMPSVVPSLSLAGVPTAASWIAQIVIAVFAIGALLKWMPRDSGRAGLATAVATVLVVPYSFNYDLTVVGVLSLLLFRTASPERVAHRALAAVALLLPLLLPYAGAMGLPFGPVILALLLGQTLSQSDGASVSAGTDNERSRAVRRNEAALLHRTGAPSATASLPPAGTSG